MEKKALLTELADATMPGVPLVEIAGYSRVLVEHHFGITQYSPEVVCIKVKFGEIRISGSQLVISKMSKEQLVICGVIESVSVWRG